MPVVKLSHTGWPGYERNQVLLLTGQGVAKPDPVAAKGFPAIILVFSATDSIVPDADN